MVTLYIWDNERGGVSKWWMGTERMGREAFWFFTLGKYASGWSPMRNLTEHRSWFEDHAESAVLRVKDRFDIEARVVWGPPPPAELEALCAQ